MTWRHPGLIVVLGFATVIALGTVLLTLPVASTTGLVVALFTSVSATCVTGLVVVDTPEHCLPSARW